jgi:hypothetical protein
VIEGVLSMHEALGSIFSTNKFKRASDFGQIFTMGQWSLTVISPRSGK